MMGAEIKTRLCCYEIPSTPILSLHVYTTMHHNKVRRASVVLHILRNKW